MFLVVNTLTLNVYSEFRQIGSQVEIILGMGSAELATLRDLRSFEILRSLEWLPRNVRNKIRNVRHQKSENLIYTAADA